MIDPLIRSRALDAGPRTRIRDVSGTSRIRTSLASTSQPRSRSRRSTRWLAKTSSSAGSPDSGLSLNGPTRPSSAVGLKISDGRAFAPPLGSDRVEAGVVAQVEVEVTAQRAVGFQRRPAATAGRIALVEALPRELDSRASFARSLSPVHSGLDGDEAEAAQGVRLELDESGGDEVNGVPVPEVHVHDPPPPYDAHACALLGVPESPARSRRSRRLGFFACRWRRSASFSSNAARRSSRSLTARRSCKTLTASPY
jgi:hypothetical protein